jgi:transcription elongation GreA/GreB family factor
VWESYQRQVDKNHEFIHQKSLASSQEGLHSQIFATESNMDRIALKKRILAAGTKAQQAIINDFKSRIEELKSSGQQYADEQQDSGALSMSQASEEQINLMTEQLNMLEEEMDKLGRISADEIHDVVHLGSVVKTNHQQFFVSVSIERFKCEGQDYFGISTKAPIYKAMEGKSSGDRFEVNGRQFEIVDLF